MRLSHLPNCCGDRPRGGVGGVEDGLVVLVVVRQRGEQQQLGLVLVQDRLEAVDELAPGQRVELLDQVLVAVGDLVRGVGAEQREHVVDLVQALLVGGVLSIP